MADQPALRPVQSWMQAVIRHPQGPVAGADSPEAVEALGWRAAPGEIVAPSARLSPEERLGIYHRGYHLRLLECLRAMHPALVHALGADLFDEFALGYLEEHPSVNRSLFELNAAFAAYLQAHRPDRDGPDEVWPDFLVDLARLERAFLEVYEGLGTEERWTPSAADLPDEPADAVVALAPCVRLIASRFPVAGYLVAVRAGEDPPVPLPEPSAVALTRRNYQVVLLPMSPEELCLLEALEAGIPLGEAARAARRPLGDAWALLRTWANAGLVASVCPVQRAYGVPAVP